MIPARDSVVGRSRAGMFRRPGLGNRQEQQDPAEPAETSRSAEQSMSINMLRIRAPDQCSRAPSRLVQGAQVAPGRSARVPLISAGEDDYSSSSSASRTTRPRSRTGKGSKFVPEDVHEAAPGDALSDIGQATPDALGWIPVDFRRQGFHPLPRRVEPHVTSSYTPVEARRRIAAREPRRAAASSKELHGCRSANDLGGIIQTAHRRGTRMTTSGCRRRGGRRSHGAGISLRSRPGTLSRSR